MEQAQTKTVADGRVWLTESSWYLFEELPEELRVDAGMFEELWSMHPDTYQKVKVFGKTFDSPRYQQIYGRDYTFSSVVHEAVPIQHDYHVKLLAWVNQHFQDRLVTEWRELYGTGYEQSPVEFNSFVQNWYLDGNHYIAKHSDKEADLLPASPIYSFTFGQKRPFVVTPKKGVCADKLTIELPDNSLFVMGGKFQSELYHSVPKRSASKYPDRRINITSRIFK